MSSFCHLFCNISIYAHFNSGDGFIITFKLSYIGFQRGQYSYSHTHSLSFIRLAVPGSVLEVGIDNKMILKFHEEQSYVFFVFVFFKGILLLECVQIFLNLSIVASL